MSVAAPSPAGAVASCSSEVDSEAAAVAEATQCGIRVAVASKRSETTEVFAEPDGRLSAEISAMPVRVHRADGTWAAVDTTLRQQSDGSWAPVAAVADVRFSNGGSAPLATFSAGGGSVAYSWPSPLPAPTVSGDIATYASPLPDVDLLAKATVDGFRYYLVVKSAAAAANPALAAVRLDLAATGLTMSPRSEGGFEAVDGTGVAVIRASGAAMWDAAGLASGAAGGVDVAQLVSQVPDGSAVANAAVAATATSLTVTPDQGLLSAPGTVFPVVIDPTSTLTPFTWGYADSTNSNRDDGVARVGDNPDGSGIYRSYFYFSSGSTIGTTSKAKVTDANFSIKMTHSYSCGDTPVNAYSVGAFSTGRNAWSGPGIQAWIGERSGHAHKGTGTCADDPQPDMTLIFDDTAVANRVQYNHDQGWSSFAVGLMARKSDGTGEGTNSWWKKFDPATARLYIAWNRTPTPPTNLKMLPANTTDCSITATALTNDNTPILCATPHDPDGGINSVYFEIWNADHSSKLLASLPVTGRTVEQPAPWTVPDANALADGAYSVLAYSCDSNSCGDPTGWGAFTVDTTPPAKPAITAQSGGTATYQPISTGVWAGGIGQAGLFKLASSSTTDAKQIRYEVNGQIVKDANNSEWWTATSGALTVSISPAKDGVNRIRAEARDAAGNSLGMSSYFDFLVKPAVGKSWGWELDGNTNSLDSTGVNSYPLTGFAPSYVAGAQTGSQAAQFNGTSQALVTTNPVIDTKGSFTVVARVKLGSTAAGAQTIVSQDGGSGSGFRLQYRNEDLNGDMVADPSWCFTMFTAASAADTQNTRSCLSAVETNTNVTGVWVDIAGVYDAGLGKVQIWILIGANAVMWEPDTDFVSTWSALGPVAVGRALQNSTATQWFNGTIDRVEIVNKALGSTELGIEMARP